MSKPSHTRDAGVAGSSFTHEATKLALHMEVALSSLPPSPNLDIGEKAKKAKTGNVCPSHLPHALTHPILISGPHEHASLPTMQT